MEYRGNPSGGHPSGLCRTWIESASWRLHINLVRVDLVLGIVPADERKVMAAGTEGNGGHPSFDTLDERVMEALEKKDCGQSALVAAVRARKGGWSHDGRRDV